MDNKKNDIYYVEKMLKDMKFIIANTEGITLDGLEENEVLCDSVLFRLIQISEDIPSICKRLDALLCLS